MAGGFGGESKWTEDYVRSLPTAPSVDSLGSTFDPELGKIVRVDRKVYEWFGGDTGGWEEVFSVPSDYSTGSSAAPAEETGSGETSSGIPVMVPPLSTSTSASPVSSNPYYPQLVQEYEAPGLMDYSSYMPADSMFGYDQYQPWTNPNNINDSIFNYQPPTIYASDPRASTGFLATPGGIIEGGYIRPTVGIEAATSSTPSSSIPVGSAGYPQGDPRNPEDRGGPDRPDGGGGADSDTQTRHDLTVPRSNPGGASYPTTTPAHYPTDIHPEIFSTPVSKLIHRPRTDSPPPAPSYPNTPPPGLLAAQERAIQLADASDYAREQAEAAVAREMAGWVGYLGASPGYVALPAGLPSHPERRAQEREMDRGYFAGLRGGGSSSGGSFGGDPGHGGPGGDFGGDGHSRK